MNEFEKQVIEMLGEIKTELNDVKTELNNVKAKVNTIMEQTAENAEVKFDVLESKKQLKKLSFEIELIKEYIRN